MMQHWIWASSMLLQLRQQRPYGLLGTGSPGRPPGLSHTSWALYFMLLYVHRDHGCRYRSMQRPYGLLGTGSPGRPPRLSHSSLRFFYFPFFPFFSFFFSWCFASTETVRTIRDGEPRTANIVQELCESRGGRPGLSVLTSPSGFRGRKDLLHRASALVTTCP